jgi:HEAT repeat protein
MDIGRLGQAASIPHLLSLALDENRRIAEAAAAAIASILLRLSPPELPDLDQTVRRITPYDGPPYRDAWYGLSPRGLERALGAGRLPPGLLGLASMHPDGHVREAAIRRLAQWSDGTEVPYLLLRLNDWVAPVREAARAALLARLHPGYAGHFVGNLSLVLRLSTCGRDDHAPLVDAVLGLLRRPECREALSGGLAVPDRLVRRACFRLAAGMGSAVPQEVLERAMHDLDPLIRLWAAREARARLDRRTFLDWLFRLTRERFMPVRREALLGLLEKAPETAPAALRSALLDPHASIRDLARHLIGKSGDLDVRSFYREAVRSSNPEVLPAAIAGLGETGIRADAAAVEPFLDHPVTSVRRAATRAVGRLDGDAYVDHLIRALEDDRPIVSHAAREALRERLRLLSGGLLWDVCMRGQHAHVRQDALALIAGLGKWPSIPLLVRACGDADPLVADRARIYVAAWLGRINRSFTPPSSEDLRALAAALESARSALPPETWKSLYLSMKGWSGRA